MLTDATRWTRLLAALRRRPIGEVPSRDVPATGRTGPDRLTALLARHVSLPVALRVTAGGEIEASVPALPECSVRGETCEAALGRLRAAVVARLVAREAPIDGDALDRARAADTAPAAGCAWTEIVVVVDGGAAGPGRGGA